MLTQAQKIRLRIQDIPLRADVTLIGDGTAQTRNLPHVNITSASAFVPGAGASSWSATGFSYTLGGEYSFSGVISANSAYRITYTYSTFSDDDIDSFLTDGGNGVPGAALEAVHALLFDAVKRARWMAADGSSYDETNAQTHLREMEKQLVAELERAAVASVSVISWGLNQENF